MFVCFCICLFVYEQGALDGVDTLDTVIQSPIVDPSWWLVVLGSIIFIIAFTGCLGALRENTIMLGIVSRLWSVNIDFESEIWCIMGQIIMPLIAACDHFRSHVKLPRSENTEMWSSMQFFFFFFFGVQVGLISITVLLSKNDYYNYIVY